jgi:hypothetical protein
MVRKASLDCVPRNVMNDTLSMDCLDRFGQSRSMAALQRAEYHLACSNGSGSATE